MGSECNDYPTLYIGEAETILTWLDEHHANKDLWQKAIIFTTTGETLNKAEIQYLEAHLVKLATENKRCKLENRNAPNQRRLTEDDETSMKGYLDELLSLMPVLNIHVFQQAKTTPRAGNGHRIFHWSGGKGSDTWKATGYETNSCFAVQNGSLARKNIVPSMHKHSSNNTREQLIAGGVPKEEENGYQLTIDYEFSSPSDAS